MLSWVFRHRDRLMLVYGRVPPPPLAGRRFAARSESRDGDGPGRRERIPGTVVRRRRWTVIVPMPMALAPWDEPYDFVDS